jgi:hypothetical protein
MAITIREHLQPTSKAVIIGTYSDNGTVSISKTKPVKHFEVPLGFTQPLTEMSTGNIKKK